MLNSQYFERGILPKSRKISPAPAWFCVSVCKFRVAAGRPAATKNDRSLILTDFGHVRPVVVAFAELNGKVLNLTEIIRLKFGRIGSIYDHKLKFKLLTDTPGALGCRHVRELYSGPC